MTRIVVIDFIITSIQYLLFAAEGAGEDDFHL